MTRELSPAERATVERFEQAPDAPAGVALTEVEREALGWQALGGASPSPLLVRAVERIIAARVAEAADAREAEVRERVEEWLPTLDPVAQSVIRAALAPADNDGEARNG